MKWTKRPKRRWVSPILPEDPHNKYEDVPDEFDLVATRTSKRRPHNLDIDIEAHYHYNGSGPKAFNGAKKWPVAGMHIAFAEGKIDERDEFIKALQDFVDNYFHPDETENNISV